MQRGARDYVQKPLDLDEIRLKVEHALRSARQRREISYYRDRDDRRRLDPRRIAGRRSACARVIDPHRAHDDRPRRRRRRPCSCSARPAAARATSARALHALGGRRDGPFIEVNCTALPEALVESELFGHEKGAFTDAGTARAGLFETAEGGAIFLDEIGHISPPLQSKFLKVIEEKTVRRVGATAARKVDVQVIAATNRDLEAAVRLGEFREDLYQRLSVAVIRMPPLREREGDAVLLARALLDDALPPLRRAAAHPVARGRDRHRPLPLAGQRARAGQHHGARRRSSPTTTRCRRTSSACRTSSAGGRVAVAPSGEIQIDFPDSGLVARGRRARPAHPRAGEGQRQPERRRPSARPLARHAALPDGEVRPRGEGRARLARAIEPHDQRRARAEATSAAATSITQAATNHRRGGRRTSRQAPAAARRRRRRRRPPAAGSISRPAASKAPLTPLLVTRSSATRFSTARKRAIS